MSEKQPDVCRHCGAELFTVKSEGNYFCDECGGLVGAVCPMCHGEGWLPESEMEADWVNYGDDMVECRECDGYGWTATPSFG